MYTSKLFLLRDSAADLLANFLEQIQFNINAYGRWTRPVGGETASFTIPDYEVAYIMNGTLHLEAEGESWDCESGSMIFLEPFIAYQVTCTSPEPLECFCFHFDFAPAYREVELRSIILGEEGPVYPAKKMPKLGMMFTLLEEDFKDGTLGREAMLKAGFIRTLVYMSRSRHPNGLLGEGEADRLLTPREIQIVNDSMMYIEENLSAPLKITDISSHLGISENHLYKSFMNVMKISPSRYLLQYKVKRAERLLRTNKYSVEQISRMLGFSSLFHFSKTFKDFFGASPKQYLKNVNV